MKINHTLLAAAVSGILVGVVGCGGDKPANTGGTTTTTTDTSATGTTTPASTTGTTTAPEHHACKGQNSCKGNGGCKTQ